MIRQGDVFWHDAGRAVGGEPGYRRPGVVVQNDGFNRSALATTVGCDLTGAVPRGTSPGNVVLRKGEANLPRRSVVSITQVTTVDKDRLVERIGHLSWDRMEQIFDGLHLLLTPAPGP